MENPGIDITLRWSFPVWRGSIYVTRSREPRAPANRMPAGTGAHNGAIRRGLIPRHVLGRWPGHAAAGISPPDSKWGRPREPTPMRGPCSCCASPSAVYQPLEDTLPFEAPRFLTAPDSHGPLAL